MYKKKTPVVDKHLSSFLVGILFITRQNYPTEYWECAGPLRRRYGRTREDQLRQSKSRRDISSGNSCCSGTINTIWCYTFICWICSPCTSVVDVTTSPSGIARVPSTMFLVMRWVTELTMTEWASESPQASMDQRMVIESMLASEDGIRMAWCLTNKISGQ